MLHVHPRQAAVLILAVVAIGCNKEDLTGALDKAKNAVTENAAKAKQAVQEKLDAATQQVQEQLNLAGSIELAAGAPIKTDACYVSLIPQGSGRPTVLQLRERNGVGSHILKRDPTPFLTPIDSCGVSQRDAAVWALARVHKYGNGRPQWDLDPFTLKHLYMKAAILREQMRELNLALKGGGSMTVNGTTFDVGQMGAAYRQRFGGRLENERCPGIKGSGA